MLPQEDFGFKNIGAYKVLLVKKKMSFHCVIVLIMLIMFPVISIIKGFLLTGEMGSERHIKYIFEKRKLECTDVLNHIFICR